MNIDSHAHRPWTNGQPDDVPTCYWDQELWPCSRHRIDEALSWLERKDADGEPLWRRSHEDSESVIESAIDALEGRTPFRYDGKWRINIDGDIR